MFSKHRFITLFVTSIISLPVFSNVKEISDSNSEYLYSITNNCTQDTTEPKIVLVSKKSKEKKKKKLEEKREQALAEIAARKAEAERLEQEAAEQSEETPAAETAETTETTESTEAKTETTQTAETTPAITTGPTQDELKKAAEEKRLKEEAEARAAQQLAAEKAAREAQKQEQEKLQAQIAKELENQKSQAEKNKKEYLSDYMVYDFETIDDTEDLEDIYYRIPNPDERDASGKTLLMRAAKDGNEWELKQLLDSKADVNLTDSDGWTALMYAVRYSGSLECVEKLLEAGAKVSVKNNYGFSALVLAACYNGNPKILTKLLEDYKASDKEVLRALVFLLSEQNISERQQLSKLQIFMDKAVPLNILYEGKTPLMYAAKYGNSTKVIQVLLDNQSSVTLRSTEGKTAFDYAINNNNLAHDETYWALNKK